MLPLDYCRKGIHPDHPESQIDPASDVHTCIDHLTGDEDGTYAANLHFGKGSSFSPDGWNVATYHLIGSANRAFEYWDTHHRAIHDAIDHMNLMMTPKNFANLVLPPKPNRLLKDLCRTYRYRIDCTSIEHDLVCNLVACG